MVVTRTYRPSDVEAVKILNRIKAQLGISGKIDTVEERRKAYYYLKGKGWNMSMLACNPDYIHDPERKALCMLFNEMRGYQVEESIKENEKQLKKYGSAFKSTYEKNKKIFEVQKKAIESASKESGAKKLEEVEKKTGVKTVPHSTGALFVDPKTYHDVVTGHKTVPKPKPKAKTVPQPRILPVPKPLPAPKPEPRFIEKEPLIAPAQKLNPVHAGTSQMDYKKLGMYALGAVVAFLVLKKVLR